MQHSSTVTMLEEIDAVASAVDPLADLKLIPAPGAWAESAACVFLGNIDAFTPPTKPEPDELLVTLRVCRHCSVRAECAAYASEWAIYGVWAGQWIDRPPRPQRRAV